MLAVGAERAPPQVLAAKFSEKLKYNARLVGGGSGVTFNSDGAAMVERPRMHQVGERRVLGRVPLHAARR